MANELSVNYPGGNTLYAVLLNSVGQAYNTSGATFEAPVNANWTNYDIALTEAENTEFYIGTMPIVAAGVYYFNVRKQAGGSPAITDIGVATGQMQWNGTAEVPLSSLCAAAIGAIEFTYTLTSTIDGSPIEDALVWITTDLAGTITIWGGNTDAFGVARDAATNKPFLDAGTYYVWAKKTGWTFTLPDIEVVA
jgi:hypothetical protein